MRGVALLAGQLGGAVTLGLAPGGRLPRGRLRGRGALRVGLVRRARAARVLVLVALAFGALGLFAALRTGSGEAVQGLFPLFFVFLFISSMTIPRNLMSVTWFRDVATVNPVSYLIEGVRSLIITGWDGEALALGLRDRGLRSPPSRSRSPRCVAAREAGAVVRRLPVAGAVAWRTLHNFFHNKSLLIPSLVFPLFFFTAFAGGPLGDPARPGLRLPRRLHGVPVRLRAAPVGGVRRRLHRLRDRARLRERLRPQADARRAAPQRDRAGLRDRRARPLDRDRVAPDRGRVRRADEGRRRRGRPPRPLPARR